MNILLQKRVRVSESVTPTGANGPVAMTSTGDKWIITPANPIAILRWGFIVNTAKDASAFVATLATRPTAGSDTNRAVSDTMTDSATARAAGIVLERKPLGANPNTISASNPSDTSLINVAEGGPVKILPGQEAVFAVTTAAASTGAGYFYAEYTEEPGIAQGVYGAAGLNYTVVEL